MNTELCELAKQLAITLKEQKFTREVHTDLATRIVNATDNSIYELLPLGVIQPFDQDGLYKLFKILNQEKYKSLCFTVRGGGTGTNGQALTKDLDIDVSKYMTRILDFNPEELSITVEPGIILSNLNGYLEPYGLFFAPHVSTAEQATIGGMIATDAAGKGSLIYGKTADHVFGLELILADGRIIDTINYSSRKFQSDLEQQISYLLEPVQDEINARFLKLKRQLSGYNLQKGYYGKAVNWAQLIAGSEGTLCLVSKAKLRLTPIPKYKVLFVIHYATFLNALRDAVFLGSFKSLAIEVVDEKVQASARTLPMWPSFAKWLNCEGCEYVSNFIEFVADSQEELANKVIEVTALLNKRTSNFVLISDEQKINQLWTIRSLAVGLAGKIPGVDKPVAFIEDAIVPPENLAAFVSDLQIELDKLNLNFAMYGHVDVGCIHVRPALNLQLSKDRNKIRPITELVLQLLKKYNGVLWGEHGKGFRGEFVPDVFGTVLYPILCKIKHIFDPNNRFNPGKLTMPDPIEKLIRIDEAPMRGQLDQFIKIETQHKFNGALLCNGNGACFNLK